MAKRQRTTAAPQTGLCLHDNKLLPASIESMVLDDLEIWELGALGCTSRNLRASLVRHLVTATQLTIRNTSHPERRTFAYWTWKQMEQSCRNLRSLSIEWNPIERDVDDALTSNIQQWLARLIQHNSQTFQGFSGRFDRNFNNSFLSAAIVRCAKLRRIPFLGTLHNFTNERLATEMVMQLAAKQLTQVTKLELAEIDCKWSNGTHYLQPVQVVSGSMTRTALDANWPLTDLTAKMCSAEVISRLSAPAYAGLTTLAVDVSASRLESLGRVLQQLPKLTTLTVIYERLATGSKRDVVWNLPTVTNLTLITSFAHGNVVFDVTAPKLTMFSGDCYSDPHGVLLARSPLLLSYTTGAADTTELWADLLPIAQSGAAKQLQTLRPGHKRQLDTPTLVAIGKCWTQIQELDIHCPLATEATLWQLLWKLPQLKTASFRCDDRIVAGEKPVSVSAPPPKEKPQVAQHLERLCLTRATDAGIEANPIFFPELTSLTLIDNGIRLHRFDILLNRTPRLTTLDAMSCSLSGLFQAKTLAVKHLRDLRLKHIQSISTLDIEELVRQSALYLRTLVIEDCVEVDTFFLNLLSTLKPKPPLETLIFRSDKPLNSLIFDAVLAQCGSTLVRFWTSRTDSDVLKKLCGRFPKIDFEYSYEYNDDDF